MKFAEIAAPAQKEDSVKNTVSAIPYFATRDLKDVYVKTNASVRYVLASQMGVSVIRSSVNNAS